MAVPTPPYSRSAETHLGGATAKLTLPASVAIAAVLFAVTVAALPSFQRFPAVAPPGWPGLALAYLLGAYLLAGGVASVVRLVRPAHDWPSAGGPKNLPQERSWERSAQRDSLPRKDVEVDARRSWVLLALLGALVLAETAAHVGPRSASWVTSRPATESELATADGYVLWLEGTPVQVDAGRFITDVDVFGGGEGRQIPPRFPRSVIYPSRAAYSFLVALVARVTAALGGVYAAFVVVNSLVWWLAAAALFDLARRATGSFWAGAVAGVLVATGLGFTFMAGNPMSNAASYGAIPLTLWLMDRLLLLPPGERRRAPSAHSIAPRANAVIGGALAAGAGLLYGSTPLFLGVALLYGAGRVPVGRLLTWIAAAVGTGYAWYVVDRWTGAPYRVFGEPSLLEWLGLALVALTLAAAIWWDSIRRLARLGGGRRAMALAAGAAALALVAMLTRGGAGKVSDLQRLALSLVQFPHHELGVLGRALPDGAVSGRSWLGSAVAALEGLRATRFELSLLWAFPPVVCVLAAIGVIWVSERWRLWCAAVAGCALAVGFGMGALSHVPHPRLVYWAFPALYVLAAAGLLGCHRLARRLLAGAGLPARLAAGVAAALVVAALLAAVVPGNASLWGDWRPARDFHAIGLE